MSTIEHSTITDPNLHEPKGTSSAALGQLYVADGAGSGAWTDPGDISFDVGSTGDFNSDLHLYKKTTVEQQLLTSTWDDRASSTAWSTWVNNIASASVSTNTISLPAGTYYVLGYFSCGNLSSSTPLQVQMRMRDTTSNATLVAGPALILPIAPTGLNNVPSAASGGIYTISGRFTIASTKNLKLQQWNNINSSNGTSLTSDTPISDDLRIWKIS